MSTLNRSCLTFSGDDDYVAIKDLSYSNSGAISAITVEAWVKTTDTDQNLIASWDRSEYWRLAVGNDIGGSQERVFWATCDSAGNVDDMIGTVNVADGEWHHICVTYDSSSSRKYIYVDGELDDEKTAHSSRSLGSGDTRYGFIGTGSEADEFNGDRAPTGCNASIADVRIWSTVRSQSEIQDNMHTYLAGDESDLVANWKLNGTATDATGNGYDGTLVGATWTVDNSLELFESHENVALYISGGNDYVAVDGLVYNAAGAISAITVEGWVKTTTSSELCIASWDRSEYWRFSVSSSGYVFWATEDSNSSLDGFHCSASIHCLPFHLTCL